MKQLIWALVVVTNTGCASLYSAYIPANRGPTPRYWSETGSGQRLDSARKQANGQWEKWDKKYVSDDVILVEIQDR